jgi:hypothetical protein
MQATPRYLIGSALGVGSDMPSLQKKSKDLVLICWLFDGFVLIYSAAVGV